MWRCLVAFISCVPGPCLAQLNVSGNALGAGGGIALAAALGESSSLRVLGMKAAGMLALPCYSSDVAATLHPPHFSRPGVERNVSMALANAIAVSTCILSLDVSSNRIDDICASETEFAMKISFGSFFKTHFVR